MIASRFILLAAVLLGFAFGSFSIAGADSPTGWDRRVVPSGTYRQEISRTPIPHRPGRPLHVYGNTVRILHQRDHTPIYHRPISRFLLGTDRLRRER